MDDSEIACRLARALGFAAQFAQADIESTWNEFRQLWLAVAGISYDRLHRQGLQWPCPDETDPGTPWLRVLAWQAREA